MLAILPAIFGSAIIAAIMSVVITVAFWYGISYLGGKFFGQDIPEADVGPTANAQSRSWNPHSTQQEGNARPRAYGKNLHHGNVVAKWCGVDANKREVLHMIVEHGDGPTKGVVYTDAVAEVYLNDKPAANFGSVDIQERLGTMNQTVMTGFEKTKLQYPEDTSLEKDVPVIVTTPNDFFDDLEYTIMFPNGLLKYQKDGDIKASAPTLKVRIREHPAGGWSEIFNDSIVNSVREPLFYLYKVNTLDPGVVVKGTQYDLEFTNLTGPGERHINDMYLRSWREVIDVAFTRPGKALVGIRAIATGQLSGSIDVKVIREDKLIRTFNGSEWTIEYSRNRAWVTWDALTQPVISGDGNGGGPFTVEAYEGFDPAYLDLEFFYNWAAFCGTQVPSGYPEPDDEEDRIACDTILDFHTDVWTFANEIANVGRAYLYWQGHILTGWIDKLNTTVTGLVTMDNMMARTWKNQWTEKPELAGKAEVFFNDSRQGFERTKAALPNESAGKYTKIINIEGVGITTRGTAIHLANHVLKRNQLIRNINSFRQYKEAFRYKLGNVIRLQCKTPNWGKGYRVIRSTAANKVTLDRVVETSVGDLLFIQTYDTVTRAVRTDSYTVVSATKKIVTIAETWLVTPARHCSAAIGALGAIRTRRIIRMEADTTNYWDVTVETYDANLYNADDLVPDLPDQNYIWEKPSNPLVRPITREEVIDIVDKMMMPQPDTDVPFTSNCTWTGDDVDTVTWAKTTATEDIIFRYKGVSYVITADSTTNTYVYWDPDFSTTFMSTNDVAVALTTGNWIVCTNTAGVPHHAIPIQLLHAGILQAGTITAALGQIANLTVDTLQIKDDAVTLPVSAYTAAGWVTGDVQSVGITTTGAPLIIIASCRVKCDGTAEVLFKDYNLKLYRGVTQIYTTGTLKLFVWGEGITGYTLTTVAYRETPGAGTYTYKLNLSGADMTCAQRFLFVMETKK